MTLLIIAGAVFILMVTRSVVLVFYAKSPRRIIEARLNNFVGH
jgi:hypothetical protein